MTIRRVAIGVSIAALIAVVAIVLFVVATYYWPVSTQTGTGTTPG